MKTMLERHAERMTPDERWATWQVVSTPLANATRVDVRRALAVATVTVVVTVAILVRMTERLAPVDLWHYLPQPPATEPVTPTPVAKTSKAVPPAAAHSGEAVARARTHEPAAESHVPVVPPAAPAGAATASPGKLAGRVLDERQQPLAYANVIVLGTRVGTMTNENGEYTIPGVPPGTYEIKVMATGYDPEIRAGVVVEGGQTSQTDLQVGSAKVVKQIDEIEVRAEKRIDTKSSSSRASISAEKLQQIPLENLSQALTAPPVRGVRPVPDASVMPGPRPVPDASAMPGPRPVPVVPTTGGNRLPNDEPFDSMFFKNYGVNPVIAADEDPHSPFAVDVDAASYTVTRRYLELGYLPPADAVRVEEFVNFFAQGYPHFEKPDFRILLDGAPSPFGPGYHLVRIGLKGREIPVRQRKDARLTFVIDVSGSMAREDRLELVKRALRLLVDQLKPGDRVGVVVYGSEGRVLLEPVALGSDGEGREQLLQAIEQLRPNGSTNAEEGLQLGYAMARRAYRADATNRIVLCSDGVANVGRTGPQSILQRVRTEADRGIHLTTVGFGMGNYNDVLMEQLADKGDGNHYYVDNLDEAHRVFVENLTGTLQVIAMDAKVQVEFDSTRVLRYRLIGFENRDVADRDFRNDKVDAGEIGAGHEVTALYEVKLARGVKRGTIATVRFRYARPGDEAGGAPDVREIAERLDAADLERRFADAAPRFRLDAAVAEFSEILRGSYWAKEGRLADVLSAARSAAGRLHDKAADEFVSLVEKAARLGSNAKRGGPEEE